MSEEDYVRSVVPCERFFRISLPWHISVEEMALFPIIKAKDGKAELIVSEFISEHTEIKRRFGEQEEIEDREMSCKKMSELMNLLALHSRRENELFGSMVFSPNEVDRVDKIAQGLNYLLT